MTTTNVLLVYKKSVYQFYFGDRQHQLSADNKFSDEDMSRLKQSHDVHLQTLEYVKDLLRSRNIRFKEIYRARQIDYSTYDFVISVGGDGTFLEASRQISNQTILGVNSDPMRSVGNFLPCNKDNAADYIDAILEGKYETLKLNRLKIKHNCQELRFNILNDILVAHQHPAAMSRYSLSINGKTELQKGAGIWISTAAGSSGAIIAAGGEKMPISSSAIQYLPRELFRGSVGKYCHIGGIIKVSAPIIIQSQMREGMFFIDGSHLRIPFRYGNTLEISLSPFPLKMVSKIQRSKDKK